MDSIATDYRLSVELPGKGLVETTPMHIEGEITLERDNQSGVSLNTGNALYMKTAKPIVRGDLAEGPIMFVFKGLSQDEVYNARNTMKLKFHDVTNKEVVVPMPTVRGSEGLPFLPGAPIKYTASDKPPQVKKPKKR